MKIESTSKELKITANKDIYNIDVLHKCFYWYTADFNIDIENEPKDSFVITIKNKTADDLSNTELLIERIKSDMIDFKLRDIVTKETINIRDLLVAKAFSNYDPLENPISEVSDPVGFTPL